MELTRNAVNATWWSAVDISARYLVQFLVVVVLARLLSPDDFGLIAMLLVFTSIGAILVDAGFATALIQRQRTSADDETTVFLFSSAAGVALLALFWFGAPAIAGFYGRAELIPLIRLVAIVLPVGALSAVPDAVLTQQLRFRDRAKAQGIAALGSGVIAIALAWRGAGVWSLAWQAVTMAALRALALWFFSGWRPAGRFRAASFRTLFGFGGYMLLAALLDTVAVRLQSLMIGKLSDARMLGYYTVAQTAQQAPTSFIGGVLSRVGLPVFSAVADQPVKLVGALRLALRVALFVFIPCMVGIALVAGPLIELLYGNGWQRAAPILTLLALSASLWPLHVLNLEALKAQGHSRRFFRLELIKKAVTISLILAFSPGGAVAIAAAVLVGSLFGVLVNTWYSGKLLGYGPVAQVKDQAATLGLSTAAAIVGWAVLHWNAANLGATAAAIAVSAITYAGGAFLFRHPALSDMASLARGLISQEAGRTSKQTP